MITARSHAPETSDQRRPRRISLTGQHGDRPIQGLPLTSPDHAALRFDRAKAHGHRLDIAAGTAVRFEPGQTRDVQLIPFAGSRRVYGFQGKVIGDL